MARDTQSRKYLLTINNPIEHDMTHDKTKEILQGSFKAIRYFCMADEVGGEEQTYHTHIYCQFSSPTRFSQIKKYFSKAHIDKSRGTTKQNRDYVFKTGKWESSTKGETNLRDSHYEWGELPTEKQGNRAHLDELYQQIKSGMTNAEIPEHSANNLLLLNHIDRVRKTVLEDKYKNLA